jgi:energy-converting hydrogenase Eha subunit B
VDQSRLPEDWNNRLQNYSFFMTKDAVYRLREFAEAMGVQVAGRTFKQIVPDLQGKYCTGTIVMQPSKRRPSEMVSFVNELGPDRT